MESQGEDEAPKRNKPTNSSHNSVLPMPNFPVEIITEILLRLPVKPLLQFRSVSKSWLSLISSPEFGKTHLLLSANNKDYTHHRVMFKVSNANLDIRECSVSSLLYDSVTEAFDLDYPDKIPYAFPRIVGSVNGLICLATNPFCEFGYLFLWNPSIRKYKELPCYKHNLSHLCHENDFDYFDFGFAYDELQDDYKVVGIFPIYVSEQVLPSRIEVKIYSLKSDCWRRIDDFQGRELVGNSAKFVKGKLHWLYQQCNIISLDLADEKWAEVEQLSCFKRCQRIKFGVFQSDLSVFCSDAGKHGDIWVMKEYGVRESWTKMFTIKYCVDSVAHIFYPTILMSNEGEILLQCGSGFTKYNTKDDSIKFLNATNLAPCSEVEIYVKSLVCPF